MIRIRKNDKKTPVVVFKTIFYYHYFFCVLSNIAWNLLWYLMDCIQFEVQHDGQVIAMVSALLAFAKINKPLVLVVWQYRA